MDSNGMLVLERKTGESLRLFDESGREVSVVILKSGKRVKIGIKAPRQVRVVRGELEAKSA